MDHELECQYGCGYVTISDSTEDAEELMRSHYSVSTDGYCVVDRRELDSLCDERIWI